MDTIKEFLKAREQVIQLTDEMDSFIRNEITGMLTGKTIRFANRIFKVKQIDSITQSSSRTYKVMLFGDCTNVFNMPINWGGGFQRIDNNVYQTTYCEVDDKGNITVHDDQNYKGHIEN